MKTKKQTIFMKNDLFGDIMVVLINDEPHFVARNIALMIGYEDKECKNIIKDNCKSLAKFLCLSGKCCRQQFEIINEKDVNNLIEKQKNLTDDEKNNFSNAIKTISEEAQKYNFY